jgi:Neuraminidase (sialidase)
MSSNSISVCQTWQASPCKAAGAAVDRTQTATVLQPLLPAALHAMQAQPLLQQCHMRLDVSANRDMCY